MPYNVTEAGMPIFGITFVLNSDFLSIQCVPFVYSRLGSLKLCEKQPRVNELDRWVLTLICSMRLKRGFWSKNRNCTLYYTIENIWTLLLVVLEERLCFFQYKRKIYFHELGAYNLFWFQKYIANFILDFHTPRET